MNNLCCCSPTILPPITPCALRDVVLAHRDVVLTHRDVVLAHKDVVLAHSDVSMCLLKVISLLFIFLTFATCLPECCLKAFHRNGFTRCGLLGD